jgi:hypothetical protein
MMSAPVHLSSAPVLDLVLHLTVAATADGGSIRSNERLKGAKRSHNRPRRPIHTAYGPGGRGTPQAAARTGRTELATRLLLAPRQLRTSPGMLRRALCVGDHTVTPVNKKRSKLGKQDTNTRRSWSAAALMHSSWGVRRAASTRQWLFEHILRPTATVREGCRPPSSVAPDPL